MRRLTLGAAGIETFSLPATLFCLALCAAPAHAVVTFDWATVGNSGNADDIHGDGYGGVDYTYRISKHEVTNAQYTEFLNAVADGRRHVWPLQHSMASTLGGIDRTGAARSAIPTSTRSRAVTATG